MIVHFYTKFKLRYKNFIYFYNIISLKTENKSLSLYFYLIEIIINRNNHIEMKRSTNLFYTVGTDTNFITFSNYGESLTGNFLSVNTKLFPSNFLCLYLPSLTYDNRGNFIKHIVAYYENKLAFLRDKCIEHNYKVESKLNPLYYLLEAINKWDRANRIVHVGSITEQNYNGTYSDIICVITASEHSPAIINAKTNNLTSSKENYDSSKRYLYGWSVKSTSGQELYQGPANYSTISPVFDGNYFYNYNTNIESLTKSKSTDDIKFNIIIPLYNLVNTDYKSNSSIVNESNIITATYNENVPLGIWFSGKEPITLSRQDTEYDPSWSLLLSSQFKPFPYSNKSPNEIDDSSKTDAFLTFSQILTRQNKIIDKFNDLSKQVLELNTKLNDVIGNLKSLGTTNNIDGLHLEIVELQKQIDELKKQ